MALIPETVRQAVILQDQLEKRSQAWLGRAAAKWRGLPEMARMAVGATAGAGAGEAASRLGDYRDEAGPHGISLAVHGLEGALLASGRLPLKQLGALVAGGEVGLMGLGAYKKGVRAQTNSAAETAAATRALAEATAASGKSNAEGLSGLSATPLKSLDAILNSGTARGVGAGALTGLLGSMAISAGRPLTERERLEDKSRFRLMLQDAVLPTAGTAVLGGVLGHLLSRKGQQTG